jgi:hypothetical protein
VVLLTLVIGLLNLCLGYAVAVWLGYGPPDLTETWQTRAAGDITGSPLASEMLLPPDPVETLRAAPLEQMPDDGGLDPVVDIQPDDEPYDAGAAALLSPDRPESWDLNEKHVETDVAI